MQGPNIRGLGAARFKLSLGLSALGCAFVLTTTAAQATPVQDPVFWVFFTDKGPLADLSAALDTRQTELSAATLERRAKVRSSDSLVDERDLRVHAGYAAQIEQLAGAKVRVQSRWLNAVSVRLSKEQKREVLELPFVQSIESVRLGQRLTPAPSQLQGPLAPPPLGPQRRLDYGKTKAQLERMGVPKAHDCGLTGKGVTVGILDSGFRTKLKLFSKIEILDEYDFVNKDDKVSNEAGDASGQDSHGTSCLGLVAGSIPGEYIGAAPGVKVLLAKTEDTASEKPVEEDYYVAGLEWVESKGADIATSSLGYSKWIKAGEKDGKTAKVTIATNVAFENGMICLTSAGNSGPGAKTLSVPADGMTIISVGATSVSGKIANFSSRGPTDDGRMKPEIVAPGEQVWVASTKGTFYKANGTSFSAPMAAGGVALLLQMDPKLSPQGMRDLLEKSARAKGKPGNTYGWGEMDIAKAIEGHCDCVDADKDGFRDAECGGRDCDDSDPKIHPEAKEDCEDEVDNDCDEAVDQDDNDCKEDEETTGDTDSDTEDSDSNSDSDDSQEPDEEDDSSDEEDDSDDDARKKKKNKSDDDPAPPSSGARCNVYKGSGPMLSLAMLTLLGLIRRRRKTCAKAA